MSDYIKRENAIREIKEWAVNLHNPTNVVLDDAICVLQDMLPADVIEVVRCKDCMYMHANKNNRQLTCNRRMLGAVRPNDYCSLGAYEDGEKDECE